MRAEGLTRAWARTWAADVGREALVAPAESVRWSRAELAERTAAAAGVLASRGVGPGDRVLLSCAPSAGTVVAYLAILRLGAVVVPVNPAATASEVAHVVATSAPSLAVVDDPGRATVDAILRPGDLLAASRRYDAELDLAGPDDVALLGFTSGTTGRPKAAALTHRNLAAGARAVVEAWDWSPDDRLLLTLPLFHMHGLGVGVNGSLTAGAAMLVLPRFDPAAVAESVVGHRPSMFFGVPTMYARLGQDGVLSALSALRLVVSGSAPLPTTLFEAVRAATGQAPLERYGMTETVMLAGNPLLGVRKAGSVGVPMPRVDLRLDPVSAEVEVRGPNVFGGYLDRPEANSEAFTADGWFRTGDIGAIDDDGYLRLVGRARDLIITGGYNVYPREVEEALLEHPAVVEAAVVGRPDDTWGEVVVAYLVVAEPVSEADLDAHAVARLSPYKRPRRWRLVDALPRNAMGKVRRESLD